MDTKTVKLDIAMSGQTRSYVPRVLAPTVRPTPVPEPVGTLTERGDDYGVIMQDYDGSERGSSLIETNATHPDRPVDADGNVSPSGKIIVPLDKGNGPAYWQMIVDFCGERNAKALKTDANGYFDTSNEWGMMCSPSGGDLVHRLGQIVKSGNKWDVVERFDFSKLPERVVDSDGTIRWYYEGQEVSYDLTPHLFNCRTNRRFTDDERWITAGGVNNVSWFAGGRETWPLVSNKVAAQPHWKIRYYPALPRQMVIYANSLIVEGRLEKPTSPGLSVIAGAYCFSRSNTFVQDIQTGYWYKADEMLVRAGEPFAASAFDYRCYAPQVDGTTPWMGNRGYRSPVPNWQRV